MMTVSVDLGPGEHESTITVTLDNIDAKDLARYLQAMTTSKYHLPPKVVEDFAHSLALEF